MAIEEAAANCYASKPSKTGKIMNACYDSGHMSVMEFTTFTYHISGVSRVLLAQLTRHRHAGFAVQSQRYVDQINSGYVIPPSIQNNPTALEMYTSAQTINKHLYSGLQNLGIPNEDARYGLSQAGETQLEAIFNGSALIHFCNLRLCKRAHWEIRLLAEEMARLAVEAAPQFKNKLVPTCEAHTGYPFCIEKDSCGLHPKLEEVYRANK